MRQVFPKQTSCAQLKLKSEPLQAQSCFICTKRTEQM